ncbi:alpha/beta hydrolase [Amnibacterium sp. CER49]|uniref:alpha/beta fold hydrolase n=1 Tax=Amnibacterium sp. CER49 TaxID=3039161 RepID=UPI00244A6335|nr:alpha/beta hydrolase [Amnibacterium sp. CER49]MDH2442519.1 alpha/beta hydrolase [Amnibacterium sp. CER49]
MNMSGTGAVRLLQRPEGRIAYTDEGAGPLVLLVPGMGDLRSVHDGLAAHLLGAGCRVVAADVRGHGDSDATFSDAGDSATASDLVALLDALDEPAVVVGSSFAGSAAVIAAAERPDAVAALVLISPFLREPTSPAVMRLNRLLYRALFARPWGVAAWASYYVRVLNRGRAPEGLAQHVAEIRASLRRPGRLAAFRRLAVRLDHHEVEPHLDGVHAPALVVVGDRDPDYRDPAAELAWMGRRLSARTLLVPEAAHYAHAQRPDMVLAAVDDFLGGLRPGGGGWARG